LSNRKRENHFFLKGYYILSRLKTNLKHENKIIMGSIFKPLIRTQNTDSYRLSFMTAETVSNIFSRDTFIIFTCTVFPGITTSGIKSSLGKMSYFLSGLRKHIALHRGFVSRLKFRPFAEERCLIPPKMSSFP